jgi:hypothetical protein
MLSVAMSEEALVKPFWLGASVGAIVAILIVGGSIAVVAQQHGDLRPRDWLRIAPDDETRWQLLERSFGGFAPAMTEVRDHYGQTFEAIADGNLELARWHWDRIKTSIELGYLRRPDRQPNADAIFLHAAWPLLDEALAANDVEASRVAFIGARAACMACHLAEDRAYFNEQRLFRETATFEGRRRAVAAAP